jgi:cell division protein FtsN
VSKRNKAAQDKQGMNKQRGGTLLGFILGALVGLGVALAVAVYITKVPMPFMTKTPPRAGDDAAAEAKKNRDWDPNAGLASKPAAKAAPADAEPAAAAVTPPAPAAKADPIGELVKAKTEAAAKPAPAPAPAPVAAAKPAPAPVAAATPVAPAAAATGSDPFNYFVQVGAFRAPEDAEQQRIKLSLMGLPARVSEREQSGRIVYRVRLGPFDQKADADKAKEKLDSNGLEATLVRVQK